jgi:hypothetical protein
LPKPLPSDEPLSAASDTTNGVPPSSPSKADPQGEAKPETPLVPKRPLMRPVSRPQPPAQPQSPQKPATAPAVAQKAEPATPVAAADPTAEQLLAEQAAMRQQPIPPPSEPKQYRAIGLLRGQYSPSDEQFTRGELKTTDGTVIEAVLLGRVMSLVRNHLDLAEDHLWVVYPRTREMQSNLHVQVVGVWEPEKLSKKDQDDTDNEAAEAVQAESADNLSPGYDDNYFSIRGEVVFYSADDKQVVIKIQQAARKSSSKAKAFKLKLEGVLPSSKTLGYFWELHVKRVDASLVITDGTAIGLIPPKKKSGPSFKKERRSFKKPRDQRPSGRNAGASGSNPPVRRDPPPKPVKRTETSGEG